MAWLASLTSLWMIWLMGRKSKWGPVMGLISQVCWGFVAWDTGELGIWVSVIGFAAIHVVNMIRWGSPI